MTWRVHDVYGHVQLELLMGDNTAADGHDMQRQSVVHAYTSIPRDALTYISDGLPLPINPILKVRVKKGE